MQDPTDGVPEGRREMAGKAVALITAKFYGDGDAHAATLDDCTKDELRTLASILAGFTSAFLTGLRMEDGTQVEPADALRGLGLYVARDDDDDAGQQ